jgi:protein-S-isoprenylcysteine O-methyltransferase Ste14
VLQLIEQPWNKLGLVLIAASLIIDAWSLFLFYQARTTFHPLKLDETSALVMHGMYRFTRNPMYLGLLLMLTGWAIYLGGLMPFVMLPVFVWLLHEYQIKHEEHMLERKFGDEYLEYKMRVRRWF